MVTSMFVAIITIAIGLMLGAKQFLTITALPFLENHSLAGDGNEIRMIFPEFGFDVAMAWLAQSRDVVKVVSLDIAIEEDEWTFVVDGEFTGRAAKLASVIVSRHSKATLLPPVRTAIVSMSAKPSMAVRASFVYTQPLIKATDIAKTTVFLLQGIPIEDGLTLGA